MMITIAAILFVILAPLALAPERLLPDPRPKLLGPDPESENPDDWTTALWLARRDHEMWMVRHARRSRRRANLVRRDPER